MSVAKGKLSPDLDHAYDILLDAGRYAAKKKFSLAAHQASTAMTFAGQAIDAGEKLSDFGPIFKLGSELIESIGAVSQAAVRMNSNTVEAAIDKAVRLGETLVDALEQ